MSEDPTRATRAPAHGRVGPEDPHADPATDPGMRAVVPADRDRDPDTGPVAADPPTGPVRTTTPDVRHSRAGGAWVGLVLSAVVLVFLLVFVLQNQADVTIQFLWLTGRLPVGVALLLAAVAGLLLVAIPSGLRILQLRRAARRGH